MTTKIDADAQELVSALVDGAVTPQELTQALDTLAHSASARASWEVYHRIGETMRGQEAGTVMGSSTGFAARFRERFAQEKALDAQAPSQPDNARLATPVRILGSAVQESANDAVFRWKLVSGLASVMAVAVLGWHWLGGNSAQLAPQQWASSATPQEAVMIRDPRLDRLLAAHQQHSGFSDSQMTSGFLRNATYTVSEP